MAILRFKNKATQHIAEGIKSKAAMKFHTAIAALMSFSNAAAEYRVLPKEAAETFVLLLAPLKRRTDKKNSSRVWI